MDQLRKAYQRAIQTPINNVEGIWQEYNAFENNLGKLTVCRELADCARAFRDVLLTSRPRIRLKSSLRSTRLPT